MPFGICGDDKTQTRFVDPTLLRFECSFPRSLKLREFLYTVMAEERSAATGKDITSEMIRLIRDE